MASLAGANGNMFQEINALKKPAEDVDQDAIDKAKMNDSIFAKIAQNKVFEISTLMVIMLNALFLGYDTDYSARWGRPDGLYNQGDRWGFPVMENFFCVYFTAEVVIRFFSYKSKVDCLFDPWFVFDATLVIIMVVETWILEFVLTGGNNLAMMDLLRLLRLARIARMGKLMRFFPELAIIVKGMIAAVRSVWCTACLIFLITYVFAIIFTDAYHQGLNTDEEVADEDTGFPEQELFGNLGKSMRHLFIMGTILDDITACTNTIRSTDKSFGMMFAFFVFVLVSSFTMLNMLIGILCEVVQNTSEGEKAKSAEANFREAIGKLFKKMDMDGNGKVSRDEFMVMKEDENVRAALAELDVEAKHFDMYAELMFAAPDEGGAAPVMSLDDTLSVIMRLRPGSKVSALDFASFQQVVGKNHSAIKSQIARIDELMAHVYPDDEDDEPQDSGWEAAGAPLTQITTLADLEKVSDQDILNELQKRVGMNVTLPTNGADGQLHSSKMVEAFEALCVPQAETDGEAWSKETYTC